MNETQLQAIETTRAMIEARLSGDSAGHDWWHVYRVWKTARHIARQEKADGFVVELAALLHDIADWKFSGGDEYEGPRQAESWLREIQVDTEVIAQVVEIILNLSYKGAGVQAAALRLEGQIVQDADRLDAIGAIGIARAFAYGGYKERPMHTPAVSPTLHATFEAYKNSQGSTINHFYEKLLLLKERMNTAAARRIAEQRHQVMEDFLQQFFAEWDADFENLDPR